MLMMHWHHLVSHLHFQGNSKITIPQFCSNLITLNPSQGWFMKFHFDILPPISSPTNLGPYLIMHTLIGYLALLGEYSDR